MFEFFKRDSAKTRNIFVIASDNLPLHDQEAGGLRLTHIIRQLVVNDLEFVFLCFKKRGEIASAAKYEAFTFGLGVNTILYGSKRVEGFIKKRGYQIRFAFVSFPRSGGLSIPLLRSYAPHCIIGYDMVDLHSLRLRREGELTSSAAILEEADRMQAVEINLIRAANFAFAVSEVERSEALRLAPDADIVTLPLAFGILSPLPPLSSNRRHILFLGGFWHTPNYDGIVWFLESIWPRIRAQAPTIKLRIGGSNMDGRLDAWKGVNGVEIVGYVDDLDAFYASGRIFVAPLRFGAGMKGKVGQSMAFGVPVVTTDIGAEGMDIQHDREVLIANDPLAFADCVLKLLHDEEAWREMQKQACSFVTKTLSVAALKKVLDEAYLKS